MKKILSMLLASCMLFAFTASAKMPTGMKYVVSGTSKTTATCDIMLINPEHLLQKPQVNTSNMNMVILIQQKPICLQVQIINLPLFTLM